MKKNDNNQEMLNELYSNINIDAILKRYEKAKTDQQPWLSKWQIINDMINPHLQNFRKTTPGMSTGFDGGKANRNYSSAVGALVNNVVSVIFSYLTSPSVKWFDVGFLPFNGLKINSSNLAPAYIWLMQLKQAAYDLYADPSSNFYPSTFMVESDWYTLGTACRSILIRKDTNKIYFDCISMSDVFIEPSGYGDVKVVFRRLNLTPRQAFDLFKDNLHPNELKKMENASSASQTHEYIEAVLPNDNAQYAFDPKFIAYTIDKMNKKIVNIDFYKNNPYIISMFTRAPNEIYGRSVVWTAMPEVFNINHFSERTMQSVDMAVFPTLLVRDLTSVTQSQIGPFCIAQGLDASGRPTIQPLQTGVNLPFSIEYQQQKLRDLRETLIAVDPIAPTDRTMTATEVNERKIQASNRLIPMITRFEHEDLNRMTMRVFSLLLDTGIAPPFPYDALGMPPEALPDPLVMLKAHYTGPMARMQKLQDIQNSDQLFQKIIMTAQVDQSIFDRFNVDRLIMKDAEIYGVDPDIMNSDEVVQQIREQRAQQEQEQREQQNSDMELDRLLKCKQLETE